MKKFFENYIGCIIPIVVLVLFVLLIRGCDARNEKNRTKGKMEKLNKIVSDEYLYLDKCGTYHVESDCYDINSCTAYETEDDYYNETGIKRVSKQSIVNDGFGAKYYLCSECCTNDIYEEIKLIWWGDEE